LFKFVSSKSTGLATAENCLLTLNVQLDVLAGTTTVAMKLCPPTLSEGVVHGDEKETAL
jgi:hypothetical protein